MSDGVSQNSRKPESKDWWSWEKGFRINLIRLSVLWSQSPKTKVSASNFFFIQKHLNILTEVAEKLRVENF